MRGLQDSRVHFMAHFMVQYRFLFKVLCSLLPAHAAIEVNMLMAFPCDRAFVAGTARRSSDGLPLPGAPPGLLVSRRPPGSCASMTTLRRRAQRHRAQARRPRCAAQSALEDLPVSRSECRSVSFASAVVCGGAEHDGDMDVFDDDWSDASIEAAGLAATAIAAWRGRLVEGAGDRPLADCVLWDFLPESEPAGCHLQRLRAHTSLRIVFGQSLENVSLFSLPLL